MRWYIGKQSMKKTKFILCSKVEHDLIKTKKKDDPSGSRTLLRLHRALEYIIAFLHKLDDIQDADLCSVISVEAYEATLMKYHPWVVQVHTNEVLASAPSIIFWLFRKLPNLPWNCCQRKEDWSWRCTQRAVRRGSRGPLKISQRQFLLWGKPMMLCMSTTKRRTCLISRKNCLLQAFRRGW